MVGGRRESGELLSSRAGSELSTGGPGLLASRTPTLPQKPSAVRCNPLPIQPWLSLFLAPWPLPGSPFERGQVAAGDCCAAREKVRVSASPSARPASSPPSADVDLHPERSSYNLSSLQLARRLDSSLSQACWPRSSRPSAGLASAACVPPPSRPSARSSSPSGSAPRISAQTCAVWLASEHGAAVGWRAEPAVGLRGNIEAGLHLASSSAADLPWSLGDRPPCCSSASNRSSTCSSCSRLVRRSSSSRPWLHRGNRPSLTSVVRLPPPPVPRLTRTLAPLSLSSLGLHRTAGLMMWKTLALATNSESPVVVVLS